LLLAVLGLAFFHELLLHPTQSLYGDHSDLLALHIPAKRFLVESWRETGELPCWCPYSFAGSPFLHDIQVGIFYPPHILLYWLPADRIGAGLSWLIVAHVILAGWGMFGYASNQGLGRAGSLVAAVGYMFAGRWMLHLLVGGHYIVVGLAWLPLVLLLLERSIREGSFSWATLAGAVFALLFLGTQPQWTFYAGIFLALWTLGTALEQAGLLGDAGKRSSTALGMALARWLMCGAWLLVVAVGLSAVQLLPTSEAAALSCRSQGIDASQNTRQNLTALALLVGPSQNQATWELQGGIGVLWLAAAVWTAMRSRGLLRWQVGLCLVLVAFALVGGSALETAPLFGIFRQPVRMLLVATFPLALLAGHTVQMLAAGPVPHARRQFLVVALGTLLLLACQAVVLRLALRLAPYWVVLALTWPAALFVVGWRTEAKHRVLAWCALLLVDLWALSWPLVSVRSEEEFTVAPACVEFVQAHSHTHERTLDHYATDNPTRTPLGSGAPLAMMRHLEVLRGYNPLDVLRYKEYLLFITDNDWPLHAMDARAGALTYPVMNDFPVHNRKLLDLLGVRYVLVPSGVEVPETRDYRRIYEEEEPVVYDFMAGGMQHLPAYTIYENPHVLPRAFVVSHAAPLPERPHVLAALKTTDFRRVVLLEDYTPSPEDSLPTASLRPASIKEYEPNRVVIDVDGDAPGWLVLTDIWYPGWSCTVDGESARVYRANYTFRAVQVPAGAHEIVFRFEPDSYRRGRFISGITSAVVTVVGLLALVRCRRLAWPAGSRG
jgi:hypothetical protein